MLTNHENFLTASTTSTDETACTQQPHLRPGYHLHAVSSSYVVVVCGPLTPWLHTAMYSPRTALHYSDQGHPRYCHFTPPLNPTWRPLIIHIILHAYPTPLQVQSWINSWISPCTGRKTQSSLNSHLNPHLKSHALAAGVWATTDLKFAGRCGCSVSACMGIPPVHA